MYKLTLFTCASLFMLTACGGAGEGGIGEAPSSAVGAIASSKASSVTSTAASTLSSLGAGGDNINSSSLSPASAAASSVAVVQTSSIPASSLVNVASTAASKSSVVVVPSSSKSIASVASSKNNASIASIPASSASSKAVISSSSVLNSSVASSSIANSSKASTEAWVFRGTPNNWAKTSMTEEGGLFVTCQNFAETNPSFKISNDKKTDWSEAYPSQNYAVQKNFSYDITFDSTSHAITAVKRETACGIATSSSEAVVSSVSSSVVASSSVKSSVAPSSVASSVIKNSSSVASSSLKSSSSIAVASSVVKSSSVVSSSSIISSSSVAVVVASSSVSSVPVQASHNAGQDCLTCHAVGNAAANKEFTTAGTIYKSDDTGQADVIVELWNSNKSMIAISMTTDANGNFYSSAPLNGVAFADLHPLVKGPTSSKEMGSQPQASCNKCHSPTGFKGRLTVN